MLSSCDAFEMYVDISQSIENIMDGENTKDEVLRRMGTGR